jgi:hypothetical protein
MVWAICLTFADMQEANASLTVDDKNGWPSDVERRQSKTMIDAVPLDHRAIWIDQDRKVEAMCPTVLGHLGAALAGDYHDLSS